MIQNLIKNISENFKILNLENFKDFISENFNENISENFKDASDVFEPLTHAW